MEHEQIGSRLSAYLDNAVGPEEKETIKHHLARCGTCRGILADLEWTIGQLKRLPHVEPPPWLTGQVMTAVQEGPAPKAGLGSRLLSLRPLRLPLLLATIGCIIISGFVLSRQPRPKQAPDAAPPPSPGPVQARPTPSGRGIGGVALPSLAPGEGRMRGKQEVPSLPDLYPPPAAVPASIPAPEPDEEDLPPAAGTNEPGLQPAEQWTVPGRDGELSAPGKAVPRQAAGTRAAGGGDGAAAGRTGEAEVGLSVRDPVGAADAIEQAVVRAGGRIRGHSYSVTQYLLFTQVEAQKLPGLLDRLSRIGSLQDRPSLPSGTAGKIELLIRW